LRKKYRVFLGKTLKNYFIIFLFLRTREEMIKIPTKTTMAPVPVLSLLCLLILTSST